MHKIFDYTKVFSTDHGAIVERYQILKLHAMVFHGRFLFAFVRICESDETIFVNKTPSSETGKNKRNQNDYKHETRKNSDCLSPQ